MKGRFLSLALGALLATLLIILFVSDRTISGIMEEVGALISRFVE